MGETLSVEVTLVRFWVWRAAVAVVAALALAVLAAWSAAMPSAVAPERLPGVLAVAALLAFATLVIAGSLLRVRAGVLSLQAGEWRFAAVGRAPHAGALEVALDLGSFLLLRLGRGRAGAIWLPVQRSGLRGDWHALRCAVYAPAAAAGAASFQARP